MTLEQSSCSEIIDKSGSKITTKRTIKTYVPQTKATGAPWGVSLKPVPRKSIVEETTKSNNVKINSKQKVKSVLPSPKPKHRFEKPQMKVRKRKMWSIIIYYGYARVTLKAMMHQISQLE